MRQGVDRECKVAVSSRLYAELPRSRLRCPTMVPSTSWSRVSARSRASAGSGGQTPSWPSSFRSSSWCSVWRPRRRLPRRARVPYPNSMAAIGDLLTLDDPLLANPPDSWSTGTNPAVNSHYLRILAANPAIKGKIYNFTGAGDRPHGGGKGSRREASGLRDDRTDRGRHVPGDSLAAKVAAKLDATLRILTAGLPNARLFVTSTRDVARLIHVLDQNRDLRGFPVCGTQVGASAAELARLHQRFVAVNKALAQVCARYRQCRFDGNAVFKMPLTLADISTADNFSLSVKGHRKLAEVTWKATFPFGR